MLSYTRNWYVIHLYYFFFFPLIVVFFAHYSAFYFHFHFPKFYRFLDTNISSDLTSPHFFCLYQARSWISNVVCLGLFCVQIDSWMILWYSLKIKLFASKTWFKMNNNTKFHPYIFGFLSIFKYRRKNLN
jgi:hypothetical protein